MTKRVFSAFLLALLAPALFLPAPVPCLALTIQERQALDNAAAADRGNADNAAVQMGDFATSVMGDKDKLNARFGQPVIDNVPLFNFSDNISGTARLKCESSERFLNISYSVSTGGNIDILIRQDLDLNGTYDIPYVSISDAAGVCVNGLAFCDPGWVNCTYKKWGVDNSASHPAWELSAVVTLIDNVAFADMGGCTCYNDSCAPSGMGTFPHGQSYIQERILESLGAGVVSMLAESVPGYSIGGATLGSFETTYSGSNKATCDGGAGNLKEDPLANVNTITSGYGGRVGGRNDAFLNPIYSAKNANDAANDNTAWNQLNNMAVATATTTPCTIEHTMVVTTNRESWCNMTAPNPDFDSTTWRNGLDWVRVIAECIDQNSDGFGDTLTTQCGGWGRDGGSWGGSANVYLPTLGTQTLPSAWADWGCCGATVSCKVTSMCATGSPCTYEWEQRYGAEVWRHQLRGQGTLKDTVNLVVSKDGCKQLDKDTRCTIWNEKVDGAGGGCTAGSVYDASVKKCVNMTTGVFTAPLAGETTVKNGVVQPGVLMDITGHRIPPGHTPVCLSFPGYLMHSVCEELSGFKDATTGISYVPVGTPPYWRVDREYRCSTDNTEDMTQIWARLKAVQKSTTSVGGIGQYQDTPVGGITIGDQSAYMTPVSDNCTHRCKVEVGTVDDTQETGSQNTKQTGTTSAGTKPKTTVTVKVLRDCKRVGGALNPTGAWECPFNPGAGEAVIPIGGYECACVSDGFGRAAGDMVNLRDIANDLTCTAP